MDDTSRRLKNEADDPAMQRPNDQFRGRADEATADITGVTSETVRNHSGAAPPSTTSAATEGDADLSRRTTQIRDEIEHTREEMTETIDAIQEKLRPSNIVANATERVKQATTERVRGMADMASDTANDMMDYGREAYGTVAAEVRQNPLPLAMIGVGAAWLLMNQGRTNVRWDEPRRAQHGQRYRGVRRDGMWQRDAADRYRAPARTDDYGNTAAGSRSQAGWSDEDLSEGGSDVMSTISRNPVPTALAAMGIAWLAFSRTGSSFSYSEPRRSGQLDDDEWRRRYRRAQRQGIGWTGTNTGSGGSDYDGTEWHSDRVQDYAGGIASKARDYADDVTSRARDYASDIGERASEYADRAEDYAGDALQSVQRRSRQAQNELQRLLQQNPLLVGAGALALGAIVGMALPETEKENEWMGETRDTVVDRAQEMARDAASKAQEAAGDVVGELASRVVSGETNR